MAGSPCHGQVRAEDEVILLLARRHLPSMLMERSRTLLMAPLRWEPIVRAAEAEGIYPVLYRNLQRLDFQGVPEEARLALESLYKANAVRNLLLSRESGRILARLGDAGIPTIPLKGLPLAQTLYGDQDLRVCADLDILVPRARVPHALQLLRSQGYTAEFAEEFFETLLLKSDIEYGLVRRAPAIDYLVELHWGLLWGPRLDGGAVEDLWARARSVTAFGVTCLGLSPTWEFLYLCAHAARHRWRGLKWLVDIHELSSSPNIDWTEVKGKAAAFGWEEIVQVTLAACHALYGTRIPPPFVSRALPDWLRLFPSEEAVPGAVKDALVFARLLPRRSWKLRYLAGLVFVPTIAERRVVRLPSFLGRLYYLLRPVRLAVRWTGRLLGTVSLRRGGANHSR
jgi:hypothetical protein